MQQPRDPLTADQLLAEGRALRALAQSLLGADGDDALQEGYAAALARPAAARQRGPWLAGTVRRLAARWRRSDRNRRARELAVARDDVDAANDPARIAEAAETAAAVANAVRGLDEPFRAAIVLRYWRGLLPEQIALELGVPHNTVRSRLQRGLERLRAQLDATHGGRSRSRSALVLLAHREDTVVAAAAGSGALLALGVAMKTKLMIAAALLVAAALVVPFLFYAPLAIARTEPAAAAPEVAAATSTSEHAGPAADREAAPALPPASAAATTDSAPSELMPPEKVVPWLARFLVVDENDAPAGDATITIHGAGTMGVSEARSRRVVTDRPHGAPVAELRTDRDGVATVMIDVEGVIAHAKKPPRQSCRAILTPAQNDVTKFVIETPVVLRGVVLRGDGSRAAGASVMARVQGINSARRGRPPAPDPVATDATGRFELPVMQYVSYVLTATLDGARTLPVMVFAMDRTEREVELVFPGGVSVRGVVVDAKGEAVPGANVRAWRALPDHPQPIPFDDERAGVTTDATGRFAIDVKKRARYQLIASANGHANSDLVLVETTAERPHSEARLVLRSFATIGGIVQRGDGSPFAGAQVFMMIDGWGMSPTHEPGPDDRFVLRDGTTTGANGRFVLAVDPGTPWNIFAQPLANNRWFRFTVADVAPGRDDVVITIHDEDLAGCIVRGDVVTAADGKPVATFDIEVVAFGADGEPRGGTRVAAKIDGHRFELPPLPLGKVFALDVRPITPAKVEDVPGFSDDTLATVRVGPFTTTAAGVDVHACVETWAQIPVRVLTADGMPARNVIAAARRQPEIGSAGRNAYQVGGDGRVLLKRCNPGPHRVVVRAGNTVLHEQEVLVTAGLNPELIVRLPAEAPVTSPR